MEKKSEKKDSHLKWLITVCVSSFILSLIFSYISTTAISDLNVLPSVIILLIVIFIGIIFDLIGTSVTIANEEDFHARASKKIKGSKTAIKLIRNSAKVANFCADVIGDICGVLSRIYKCYARTKTYRKCKSWKLHTIYFKCIRIFYNNRWKSHF